MSGKSWFFFSLTRVTTSQKWGNPREWSYQDLLNAILYVTKTVCQWCQIPTDLLLWRTAYAYFENWRGLEGVPMTPCVTKSENKPPLHQATSPPSLSKNFCKRRELGYDGGKKVSGRKWRIMVDTIRLFLLPPNNIMLWSLFP